MPNYNDGKIYKLTIPSGLIYIGSTTQQLCERKAQHKSAYKCWKKGTNKVRTSSFKLFEEDEESVEIVLIEKVNCDTKEELHKRERFYIDSIECVNKVIPTRTLSEYCKEYQKIHKETLSEKKKIYIQKNIEKIKISHKVYRKNNIDKITKYQNEYRKTHKKEKQQTDKAYYEANKNKIFERIGTKYTCICGSTLTHGHKAEHNKTKKHQNFISS